MIGMFFEKLYIYRVKQELLAQRKDVSFVEYVVNLPNNRDGLIQLYKKAYYGAGKIAPFMGAIFVLVETLEMESVPLEIQENCVQLLSQRLLKAKSNRQFWMAHIMILGHAEEIARDWMVLHENNV